MNKRVYDLELEILSPCFVGGAYQQPEFRIASIRGIWRYWYRALYGRGDETAPTSEEVALFGSTEGRGQARLILAESVRHLKAAPWQRRFQSGADYLLFTMDMNKRSYLEPGARVPLRLLVDRDKKILERAERSLAAALSFNGIGARARRMGGAVHLASKSGQDGSFIADKVPANSAELAEYLGRLLAPAVSREIASPRYHVVGRGAFTAGVLEKPYNSWREALDEVGASVRDFRSHRPPDYVVAKTVATGGVPGPDATITRAAFGLPIQFRFRSLDGKGPRVTLLRGESDRRGSPFLLTLERLGGDRLAVVWCLFRAPLTPKGRIRVGEKIVPEPAYQVIEELLTRPEWKSHRIAG